MLCLLKHDPHWWQANWSTEKEGMVCKGLGLSLSLQCHSLRIVFNVATSRDSCSWPLKLATPHPDYGKQRDAQDGRLFGWPSYWSISRMVAMTACWVATGTQRNSHHLPLSNSQSERAHSHTKHWQMTSTKQPASRQCRWGRRQPNHNRYTLGLSTQALAICDQRHTQAHSLTCITFIPGLHKNVLWYKKHLISKNRRLNNHSSTWAMKCNEYCFIKCFFATFYYIPFYLPFLSVIVHYHWSKSSNKKFDKSTSCTDHLVQSYQFFNNLICLRDSPKSHATNWLWKQGEVQ